MSAYPSRILDFIANETKGYSYKSFKYCYDDNWVPTLPYDDKKVVDFKHKGETDSQLEKNKDLTSLLKDERLIRKPLFGYFLDGSRRTYKVDDLAYDKKLFPAVAGQIGIACCERIGKDHFTSWRFEHSLVLAISEKANAGSGDSTSFFTKLRMNLNKQTFLDRKNIALDKILYYQSAENSEYEKKAIARIQDEMIDKEKKMVNCLVGERLLSGNSYLLKDGSLEYAEMKDKGEFGKWSKIKNNYQYVVGASKAFNPEILASSNKRIARIIAELPLYHRTPAIKYTTERVRFSKDIWFSVWYLRIRAARYCHSPYDGVIKLEKVLVNEREEKRGLTSDEIDLISVNIIRESFPVCYGQDSRWAKHLYPIFLTERYAKSKYLSDLHFINLF